MAIQMAFGKARNRSREKGMREGADRENGRDIENETR
jgi:hypothetical protein